MKIILIESADKQHRYRKRWDMIVMSALKSLGYDVFQTGVLDSIGFEHFEMAEAEHSSRQLQRILSYLNFEFSLDDKNVDELVIFINEYAYNAAILELKRYADLNRRNWKFIGLWPTKLIFNKKHPYSRSRRLDAWSMKFEHLLFQTYDANIFNHEFAKTLFLKKRKIRKEELVKKAYYIGEPFEYLTEIAKEYNLENKEDIILIPAGIDADHQIRIIEIFKRELPKYEFIYLNDNKLDRKQYYQMLAKAKMVLSINTYDYYDDTFLSFEALAFKVIPLAPEFTRLGRTLPRMLYTFDYWIVMPPMINFVRQRGDIQKKISNLMDNYESLTHYLVEDTEKMKQRYSIDKLIDVIEKLKEE